MKLKDKIFQIKNKKDFEDLEFEIFNYQYTNNKTYKSWCNLILTKKPEKVEEIPFLPIEFFKTKKIFSNQNKPQDYFLSSGTTSMKRSQHLVFDKNFYIQNTYNCFNQFFESVDAYCYIFLLPNYLEQEHSSLICMCDSFIKKSKYNQSGFYKNNLSDVITILQDNEKANIPTILFGVTYALLDLIEIQTFKLKNTLVFETGGMKGRRKEIPKQELHTILKNGFGVKEIYSEYGMCELMSQAYSLGEEIFYTPNQMRVLIKEINDPKSNSIYDRGGRINIIDLANIDTCSFIETQDIGMQLTAYNKKSIHLPFKILGRIDHSAIRGCNLMYEN